MIRVDGVTVLAYSRRSVGLAGHASAQCRGRSLGSPGAIAPARGNRIFGTTARLFLLLELVGGRSICAAARFALDPATAVMAFTFGRRDPARKNYDARFGGGAAIF